jgi:PAS domain S-box-containing protein
MDNGNTNNDKIDREHLEEQLKEMENRYKLLTELSPDCIKMFDMNGKLTFINGGGRDEHGLKNDEEAMNFKAIDSVIDEDKPKFMKAFEDARNGIDSVIELRHTKEGSKREICSEMVHPIKDSQGKVVGILGVSRDITEFWNVGAAQKKIADELEKLNKSMIGRELKMLAQKNEIEALKAQNAALEIRCKDKK